jgi:CRP-like cAMP-binding protein
MSIEQCYLPFCELLNTEQIEELKKNSFIVHHKKNDIVVRQDMPISHILFIKTGLIKIYREISNNRYFILKIITPGNFIEILSPFSRMQFFNSASALEDSDIIYTEINCFKKVISESGQYALNIMNLMGKQGLYLSDKLVNLSQKQVPGRIAEILLFFSKEIFKNNSFELPLTRQELADLISSTKETVSRTLSEFKMDKIIDVDDKKITLLSNELLEVLSKIG